MSLSPAFLDEVRARVRLSGVIARRVKLEKAGREMRGCCPFHNEKTPSFYVNDDKGFYHCFGCGAHGDVIRFLTDAHALPFIEAVRQLAGEAGLEMPAPSHEARARAEAQDSLADLAERAATWFCAQLAGEAGGAARAYLARRGVAAELARSFGLGLAPDARNALRSHMNDVPADQLAAAGLIGIGDDGQAFDRFRGRLMFPIRSARGRVVGFGGRALADAQQPKYLNSADGPLFDKGRLLYNLDRAALPARRSARLVVVEGYMDVIGLAGAGITEAVAPLGTALSEAQLALAWRIVDVPILCFDGDAAGSRAALRAAMRALPLLQPGRSLAIATLPQGQDPDDVCRQGGAAAFETVLAGAVPLIDHLWASHAAGLETATPERRALARQQLRDAAASIADPDVRSLYRAEFDQRFDAAFMARPQRPASGQGWRAGNAARSRGWVPPPPPLSPAIKAMLANAGDPVLNTLLIGLVRQPMLADCHGDALAALQPADPLLAGLLAAILAAVAAHPPDGPGLDAAGLATHLHDIGMGEALARLLASRHVALSFTRAAMGGDAGQAAADFAAVLARTSARAGLVQALDAATARVRASLEEEDYALQQALRREIADLDATMIRLAESRRSD